MNYKSKKHLYHCRMKKGNIIILTLSIAAFSLFGNTKISGVEIEESLTIGDSTYSLSGAGIRKKAILRLYVGSLYTDQSISNESAVLQGPSNSVINLDIISRLITSELMAETVQEGFENALGGDTGAMQPKIDDFISVFREEIIKGDVFTFLSLVGDGVVAYKNGRVLTEIKDDDFRRVLFSIWLGNDPADARLKKAMLGDQ